ncbi:uncharacterized protein PHACADRAFT_214674 [Phanerochaete carnosa HHB-10118-sp]|uniref:FAD/NAD(P)-binding domain-containing protein n=1 Tax=Phanerochaete carnosa (strain HHB-10118-sp) TaxID=650164 RepID=K5VCD9_PHACS|nr:uncharacterized protein PHACADRAFT_214674 [Phanerochaete carnosa HHB-10118-sp]EKM48753.1 hypothetical protein PHACADRAFT_214674 [Phanerochaete carnosa HHB-10118-sp]
MSKKIDEQKKNVVIVGGGAATTSAIQSLANKLDHAQYNLILLDARPYYVHNIATLRMTVSDAGQLEDRALMPYDRLQNVTFVQGKLVKIEETTPGKGGVLVLENDERLDYTALVLATGSQWNGPPNLGHSDEKVRANIEIWRERFSQAKNVVIAGGGAAGIELAGEIREAHPNTKVTIVHSETHLLNDVYPEKLRKNLEQKVLAQGITLIDQDCIDVFPDPLFVTDVVTRKGKTIKDADLVVRTLSPRNSTSAC